MDQQQPGSAALRMESLRLNCQREDAEERQKLESLNEPLKTHIDSIKAQVEETIQNNEKLWKLKSCLKEAEDDCFEVLSAKARKEGKQMAISDSMVSSRARLEELSRALEVHRAKRDQFKASISQQVQVLGDIEARINQNNTFYGQIQEALSWYNSVLGLQIEAGRGVKFMFNNIDNKHKGEEYSFMIHYEDDRYTLLACDPQLDDAKELLDELNRTNGLFKFAITMRHRFQQAAFHIHHQVPSTGESVSPMQNFAPSNEDISVPLLNSA